MQIGIRTRHLRISNRYRAKIEIYLRKMLGRDKARLTRATLNITLTPLAGAFTGIDCRLVVHAAGIGHVEARGLSPRLGQAIRQATGRVRQGLRKRRQRRRLRAQSRTRRPHLMTSLP